MKWEEVRAELMKNEQFKRDYDRLQAEYKRRIALIELYFRAKKRIEKNTAA